MILIGELQAAYLPVLAAPKIPGWGPIIPPFKHKYVLVPPSLRGGWGSFTQALGLGPSQGPWYALGTSNGASPSTSPFAGGNDSYDGDTNQFISSEDSQ